MNNTIKAPTTSNLTPAKAAELQELGTQLRAIRGDKSALAQLDLQASKGELGWGNQAIRAFGKLMAWGDELGAKIERPTFR